MNSESLELSSLLLPELEAELNKTRRTLERIPEGQDAFRPHEKSKSLLELANHLATVCGLGGTILATTEVELGGSNDPRRIVKEETMGGVLARFEELAQNSLERMRETSNEGLAEPWQALAQGKVLFSGTRYMAYRNIAVNHMIHHRAQLGTYLRLLNVPVPSVFGPSADEPLLR